MNFGFFAILFLAFWFLAGIFGYVGLGNLSDQVPMRQLL